ncbi:MAG: site-specific DNA-methyltransferase [Candidatus Babeliales bacterium]|jgi:site-specific DNA-methyltransferase (adenine-specific)
MPISSVLKMIKGALGIGMVHNGDSTFILKEIPNCMIDCIVTDPPYGYSFMGKNWDKAVPSVDIWRECYRILKPGAFMFVMSAPRQDVLSQMIVRIAQAGFDTSFTSIYWTYATGFPKAMNIAKAVDKRECEKQLIEKLGRKPTNDEFEVAWKNFRTVTGTKTLHDIRRKVDEDNFDGQPKYGTGAPLKYMEYNDTTATTTQAKALDGSYGGFQPKPAVEIIIVAMKPLSEKTFVDQALTNGKGVTWLDNCRVPTSENIEVGRFGRNECQSESLGKKLMGTDEQEYSSKGRFPANLLVEDDVLNDGKITKSTGGSGEASKKWTSDGHIITGSCQATGGFGDIGSFSRYFDLDAWWLKTVENLPENVKETFPFLIVPKASKSERNKGCEDLPDVKAGHIASETGGGGGWKADSAKNPNLPMKNFHPTVKPLKLMCYLVTLGSQPNDVILDPFNGSGTTCLAAKITGRRWLGVDITEEYCKIQSARLDGAPIVKHETSKESKVAMEIQQPKQDAPKPIINPNTCPICGNEMRRIGKNYYCVKAGCDGKR